MCVCPPELLHTPRTRPGLLCDDMMLRVRAAHAPRPSPLTAALRLCHLTAFPLTKPCHHRVPPSSRSALLARLDSHSLPTSLSSPSYLRRLSIAGQPALASSAAQQSASAPPSLPTDPTPTPPSTSLSSLADLFNSTHSATPPPSSAAVHLSALLPLTATLLVGSLLFAAPFLYVGRNKLGGVPFMNTTMDRVETMFGLLDERGVKPQVRSRGWRFVSRHECFGVVFVILWDIDGAVAGVCCWYRCLCCECAVLLTVFVSCGILLIRSTDRAHASLTSAAATVASSSRRRNAASMPPG